MRTLAKCALFVVLRLTLRVGISFASFGFGKEKCGRELKMLAKVLFTWANARALQLSQLHLKTVKAMKVAGVSFAVALILGLSFLSACPALHEIIHPDAANPDHDCAVMLFAHGQVGLADATVAILQRLEPVAVAVQPWREIDFVSTDVLLLPSRGPPSSLSFRG
jgi:hypothetical protein